MILRALTRYYRRLQEDPDSEIAAFGYSLQKITFCVIIERDGTLNQFEVFTDEKGKLAAQNRIVPGGAKPPGAGINPGLFWDNTGYMLGWKPEDEKPDRTRETFTAFVERHQSVEEAICDPGFSAVVRFLEQWNPDAVEQSEHFTELQKITSGFGVFRLRGETGFVHDSPKLLAWWNQQLNQESTAPVAQCLVSGLTTHIALTHTPQIKGVLGAQSGGALLVSYNTSFTATESYGKKQGCNGPVSEQVAFEYSTALNRLLSKESKQRLQVADATTVFWTDQPAAGEELIPGMLGSTAAEDEELKKKVGNVLGAMSKGKYPNELGPPETQFYILGLSPNAARISVRFWLQSTLGEVVEKVRAHFDDLNIVRMFDDTTKKPQPEFPGLWAILKETARETKDIPPLLAGGVLRAILQGTPYPQALYAAILRRLRADRDVNYYRAAIIKACLNRTYNKEISVALDENRTEPAYHLGRLFAALEKAQEDALGDIGSSIKDRYFSAASAAPGSVFPRLIRGSQHHLGKLETGHKIAAEKRIQEITAKLDSFPAHLGLQEQGLFAIGYYHQRKDFFTKKEKSTETPAEEN